MSEPTNTQPGSDQAVALGCECPRLDNARGRGAYGTRGPKAIFVINGDCPIHGPVPAAKRRVAERKRLGFE